MENGMLFNFNDVKSRKQVNFAISYANDTKRANAQGLIEYQRKKANLLGSRGEWELQENIPVVT